VFWRKKQLAAVAAVGEATVVASVGVAAETTTKPTVTPQERKEEQKSSPAATTEVQILTRKEIEEKISALSVPGSTVFFYLSGSPASGGPLGQGAAVIELNPEYPGKNQKRYTLYVDHVDGLQPVGKRQKIFGADAAKDLATWVKDRHHKR
jgi:hypothetical protein